jgi:hypothetical protein
MRTRSTREEPEESSERTRLTPKSAKDTRVVRVSEVAYTAAYVFAQKHNMTFADAVSYLIGVAWKHLYNTPINAPGLAMKSPVDELNVAINRAILEALGPDAAKGVE